MNIMESVDRRGEGAVNLRKVVFCRMPSCMTGIEANNRTEREKYKKKGAL